VSKQWEWGGTRAYALRFRAEAFNLTNHAQFDEPQYTLTNAAFARSPTPSMMDACCSSA